MNSIAKTPQCLYLDSLDGTDTSSMLCAIEFGSDGSGLSLNHGLPSLSIPSSGAGMGRFYETWTTGVRRDSGEHAGLVFAYDDDYLFCAGRLTEVGGYSEPTYASYIAAFELADALGFSTPVRMWNYIGGINSNNREGLEIYRDFCRGRARAFDVSGKRMPAATGVGADDDGITFYLLSGRFPSAIHLENPAQIPAYRYPQQYGPRSPSFARATLVGSHRNDGDQRGTLYISGTASIIGHDTVQVGSVDKQCDVALDNIRRLMGQDNLHRHGIAYGLTANDIHKAKVYVRRADDLDVVRGKCASAFSRDADIRFLNVDICRRDLLVEIEAIA